MSVIVDSSDPLYRDVVPKHVAVTARDNDGEGDVSWTPSCGDSVGDGTNVPYTCGAPGWLLRSVLSRTPCSSPIHCSDNDCCVACYDGFPGAVRRARKSYALACYIMLSVWKTTELNTRVARKRERAQLGLVRHNGPPSGRSPTCALSQRTRPKASCHADANCAGQSCDDRNAESHADTCISSDAGMLCAGEPAGFVLSVNKLNVHEGGDANIVARLNAAEPTLTLPPPQRRAGSAESAL